MFTNLCTWLATNSTGVIFTLLACLALGYAVGGVKFGPIALGSTVGTLLIGVVISAVVGSQAAYDVPASLRYIFFFLFIFALGYQVGPVFVKSLKSSGIKLILQAVMFTFIALLVGIGCKFVFGLENGELIGLYAGTMTQSSILGAAQSMMPGLGITGAAAEEMNARMTAAYALGYLISYAGCVIFIKCVMPYVVGCKGVPGLRDEVKKEIEKNGHQDDTRQPALFNHIRIRTFRVGASSELAGQTVSALEARFPDKLLVETLLREQSGADPKTVPFTADTTLQTGDVVALVGELECLTETAALGLEEVADAKYQKIFINRKTIVLTKDVDAAARQTVLDGQVVVAEARRGGKMVDAAGPLLRGDVLELLGSDKALQRVVKAVGYAVDSSDDTNVIFMSAGMMVGLLVGILSITLAGVPIGLGTSGGLILLGIFCGWYNEQKPGKGYISPGALWLMKSIGLNLFVACLGLTSGATFLSSIQEMGVPMVLSILIMSLLPHVLTVLAAKVLLHLSPVELLGGTCGSGTNTAALNALSDETGSSIFAASYTPAYAMANITLTFLGVIGIALFH